MNSAVGILAGVTASGKSALALEFARARPRLEIVNADSLLVYRGMNIGTAKPTAAELASVPHHLVDIREPSSEFTAADFKREVEAALTDIAARGKRALLVGGTGFYLKALLFGLWDAPPADPKIRAELSALPGAELQKRLMAVDEDAALRIGPNDQYRLIRALEILRLTGKTPTQLEAERPSKPDPRYRLWVTDRAQTEIEARIASRARAMLKDGLVEETQSLQKNFPAARALGAIGYAQVVEYLAGVTPAGRKPVVGIPGLLGEIELATRQLVKSQRTFFRGLLVDVPGRIFVLEKERAELLAEMEAMYGA